MHTIYINQTPQISQFTGKIINIKKGDEQRFNEFLNLNKIDKEDIEKTTYIVDMREGLNKIDNLLNALILSSEYNISFVFLVNKLIDIENYDKEDFDTIINLCEIYKN